MPKIPVDVQIQLRIIHRFWEGVNKNGHIHPIHGQCWEWTKGLVGNSYGAFRVSGEQYAHRMAYKLLVGEIPIGMWVLHKCDNPICVNPSHLFLGTNQDNTTDRNQKQRQARGEKNGMSKLAENDVLEIRSRFVQGHPLNGRRALAKEFGVSTTMIWMIIRRVNWNHLPDTRIPLPLDHSRWGIFVECGHWGPVGKPCEECLAESHI